MSLDQVDQAIISQALIAAAKEMGIKLVRSAYSPIVREANDCSAALLDVEGNVVSQAELIPMQLGPIATTFRACAELYPPETLEPDDFYINNDPYHGGQHVPDIFIFTPIFLGTRLVGFSATVAHHLDLGGGAPGLNMAAGDVYQEGLIFPPSRYNVNRDWNGGPFERLVRANVRVPEKTIGDCNAQFAANGVGARRVDRSSARSSGRTRSKRRWRGCSTTPSSACGPRLPQHPTASTTARTSSTATEGTTSRSWCARASGDCGRYRLGRLRGDVRSGAYERELPLRFDDRGRALVRQVGAHEPRHPLQRRCEAADQYRRALRLAAQSPPSGPGARANAVRLPRLQCGDEGSRRGGARAGDGGRFRHHARHLPLPPR